MNRDTLQRLALLAVLRAYGASPEAKRGLDAGHPGRKHALSAYARRTEAERALR